MNQASRVRVKFRMASDGSMLLDFWFEFGARRVTFMLEEREVEPMLKGTTSQDILRRVEVQGDLVLSYSVEGLACNGPDHGEMKVKYDRFYVPQSCWRMLLRYARLARRSLEREKQEAEAKGEGWRSFERTLELGQERRARWLRLYGWGRGKLKVDHLEGVADRMATWAAADPTGRFSELVDHVGRIALNSTWAFHQQARVRWCCDGESLLYWEAFGHDGRRRMNGGLLRSVDKDGKVQFSLHT